MAAELKRSTREVLSEGVIHFDHRTPNILWNEERQRIMLIDFDQSVLRPASDHGEVLRPYPRKRRWPGVC